MVSEDHVEGLRREIGEKAAHDGERLHDTASESVRAGYRRVALGFGSNVHPRKFGRGAETRSEWECVCGTINKRYLNQCSLCGVHRAYSDIRVVENGGS